MKNIKRKGFTLVELLIVIVVIGILSSMMMMSSTEATSSARASNIVSNLRNLKTAALAYYVDHLDAITANPNVSISGTSGTKSHDAIFKYLGTTNIPDSGDYRFANSNGNWYVSYDIDGAAGLSGSEKTAIKTKLAGRAKSVGLCKNVTSMEPFTDSETAVAMFIR